MKYYDTVDDMSDELGISRATLYRRAKLAGISLSEIKTGISETDVNMLKQSSPVKTQNSDSAETAKLRRRIGELSDELRQKDSEIDKISKEYHDAVSNNDEREKQLLQQLTDAHELLNQQQRLQLSTQEALDAKTEQLRLTTAPRKGFWARLFGGE